MTQSDAIASMATVHLAQRNLFNPARTSRTKELNMRSSCRQRERFPRVLASICVCSMFLGCNNESRQFGARVPSSGQSEAGRETYKAQNSRVKSSNIKTH